MSILGNEFLQTAFSDTAGIQPGSSSFSLDSSLNDPAFKSLNPIMQNPALSNPPTNSSDSNSSQPTTASNSSSIFDSLNPFHNMASLASMPGASWGRIAGFIVGLICIGAGLLMFKQTQTIITTTAKAAGKAAVAVA